MQTLEQQVHRRPLLTRTVVVALWALVVVIGIVLTVQRFTEALGPVTGDDLGIFVRAGAEVRAGQSPWDVATYVYSPLIAWVMTPFPSLAAALGPWAAISLAACWATIAVVTATFWRMLRPWQRPALALFAVVTILFSHVTETELQLGQVDTLVLLSTASAVLLASLRLPVGSGLALAISGLVKSWPFGSALWIFRRGAENRWRSLLSLVAAVVVVILIVLITGGPRELGQWISSTLSSTRQPLLAYSVWGFGRFLFTDNGVMHPLVDAPILGSIVSWVLAAAVVALIAVILRRPGSPSLAMWNLTAVVVLLLPVSHLAYRILFIPMLWVWVAHALRAPRVRTIATAVVVGLVWLVTDRTQPLYALRSDNHLIFSAITLGGLLALTVSVIVAARADRTELYAEPGLREPTRL